MGEQNISSLLINWYLENKRDLPWRETDDPYVIWISEIILQQTRVNQGLGYFYRFIDRFPNVQELAESDEEEVLKFWQGLGYYSRARNLHKAARQIYFEEKGVFPTEFEKVLALPGIGTYTASAICSFAYNQPYAVVDGNVYRVLSRLFGVETPINTTQATKQFADIANELLDKKSPGLHNQAMMEFGALFCTPKSPDCNACVLNASCYAFSKGLVSELPRKMQKNKVKERFFNYVYVQYNHNTLLCKRTKNDIWRNLYEFPLIESDHILTVNELLSDVHFQKLFEGLDSVDIQSQTTTKKHVLSHRNIFAQVFTVQVKALTPELKRFLMVEETEVAQYPVSRLMELFLEELAQ